MKSLGCPSVKFSNKATAFKLCDSRLGIPIQDCKFLNVGSQVNADFDIGDIKKNGKTYWKQGGKFYRDCITWEIASNAIIS